MGDFVDYVRLLGYPVHSNGLDSYPSVSDVNTSGPGEERPTATQDTPAALPAGG